MTVVFTRRNVLYVSFTACVYDHHTWRNSVFREPERRVLFRLVFRIFYLIFASKWTRPNNNRSMKLCFGFLLVRLPLWTENFRQSFSFTLKITNIKKRNIIRFRDSLRNKYGGSGKTMDSIPIPENIRTRTNVVNSA